jgi:putative transposase
MFAAEIRKKRIAHMRGYPQWRWHLDEMLVKVNGKLRYLWRAVDHEGEVLEAVVTSERNKAAARKLLKRVMKKYGAPRSIVTDRLRAYSAAMNEIGVAAERHEVGGRLNNRAENSHQPFRRRERAMQRFRSTKTLQKFSSIHAQVHNQFNQERHLVTRQNAMPDAQEGLHVDERRLAAILAADVAGYSRLMGRNEEEAVRDLEAQGSRVFVTRARRSPIRERRPPGRG